MAVTIDIQIACDDPEIPAEADMHRWIEAAVEQSSRAPSGNTEVAVRVVDAEEIQTLNNLYRQQDKATNVLSFPAGNIEGLPAGTDRLLGDVIICASVVAAESGEQGKALADHWAHMLVHGTLHLLGFDHQKDAEAVEMESLETQILGSGCVKDPYESS